MRDVADYELQLGAICRLFHVSPSHGFLLLDPLTELPAEFAPWMDATGKCKKIVMTSSVFIEDRLSQLIATRQLREVIHAMPVLGV